MCTVSFYKDNLQTIITSNRDEHHSRANALPPEIYYTENFQLIYCKDAKANGTWMVLRNDGTVIVLLNGAFERHTPKYPYRKSRGLVVLDIINEKNCLQKYKDYDLTNIEPFTIILYSNTALHECIWNGIEKFITQKSTDEKYIWSSVTLYDRQYRQKKENLFEELINSNEILTKEKISDFHHSKQDTQNGFIINRNEQLFTFSITQITLTHLHYNLHHHDLLSDKQYTLTLHAENQKSIL